VRLKAVVALFTPLVLFAPLGNAQEVVAAQSGIIHYSEGAVFIDGLQLERKSATFPLLKDGSVLQTQKGRVELMLTPGAFLRLDEKSSVKMIASALTSTTVEFLNGSAILDALAAEGDIPIALKFRDASISFSKPGVYRIDSETQVFQSYNGEAVVSQHDKQTRVDSSRLYFFELATDTKKFNDGPDDEFLDWARNRNQVITAENQAAQADDDEDAAADLSGAPSLNYNLPNGGVSVTPGFPGVGNTYPYSGIFFNNYAVTPFWTLPPLPVPALIIRRPWPYRAFSPTRPRIMNWNAQHPSHPRTWAASPRPGGVYPHTGFRSPAFPRPATTYSRPPNSRPVMTPRAPMAGAHVGRR